MVLAVALVTAGHAVIYKREPRSAALWVLLVWLLPIAGAVLYVFFGVNRVQRRAARLRRDLVRVRTTSESDERLPVTELVPLARLVGEVVERPLLPGNSIVPLVDGDEAYPAMLQAIDEARTSVALASYIFHADGIGENFVNALIRARQRGVAVRVLIDDVSCRFSLHSPAKRLRQAGVSVGDFNPPLVPARLNAFNLRNHRKILVVDGELGFTGGMNIDRRYWGESAYRDTHFRLNGPVVAHLMEVFADDWLFTTDEALRGPEWFPPLAACGDSLARGIEAGPDEAFERLRWAYVGSAERRAAHGPHLHALLPSGRRHHLRARRRRAARRRRRHRPARGDRPAAHPLGDDPPALAGARPWLPRLDASRSRSTTPS